MRAKIIVDKSFIIGEVDKRIFGSFIEHLGRAVYGGIYEPGHHSANEYGFRQDVIELVRELGISIVRYPGGNFVSSYNWEDGVGPVGKRPEKLDLAWKSLEPNFVGIQEFANWAEPLGIEIMIAVNLGTRGVDEAKSFFEYYTHSGGSSWSDLRISHGREKPYSIKTCCLGNEMDGNWQIGHRTAYEYGRLANETAKVFKMYNRDIELVVCGSSSNNMSSFPEWEREVLEQCYDNVDYISLHKYAGNQNDNLPDFLASSVELENYIKTVAATCDLVKAHKRSSKTINLSFDEWNVWYHSIIPGKKAENENPWSIGSDLLEDIYNLEDAIVVGLMLNVLLRYSDRVKIACLSQLVNVIAPVKTESGGPAWRQTIYYPFYYASRYGRGKVLESVVQSPVYHTKKFGDISYLDSAIVYNEDNRRLVLFLVNRSLDDAMEMEIELKGFGGYKKTEQMILCHPDPKAINTASNPDKVIPRKADTVHLSGSLWLRGSIPPLSWNIVILEKEENNAP